MIEWLAMPATGTESTTLYAWTGAFSDLGHAARVAHEGPGVAWIEVAAAGLRGYVVIEGGIVEAINFELRDADPSQTLALLRSATSALGWELHQEDDEEDDANELP